MRPCEVSTVTIRLNFVTRCGAKLVGGFEAVRVTKDLKKFAKTFANMLNNGVFLKGSGGQDVHVSEPMLDEEQAGQCQRRIFE